MATFVPKVTFTGYPVDDRTPVVFVKKRESIEVSDAFVQLMRAKGLVADPPGDGETRPRRVLTAPAPAVAKKIATAAPKRRTRRRRNSGAVDNA
jgi:hypothetical protein